MPAECRQYWGCMRTAGRAKINPAYHPYNDDWSDRCIAVECDIQDAAIVADVGAHARKVVRNILRRRPALAHLSEKTDLMWILKADRAVGPNLTYEEQHCCSEWLAAATCHKPFHNDYLSDRFLRAVPPLDEFDGWVKLSEILNLWPTEGCDRCRPRHLETVPRYLSNRHWAHQAFTVLNLIGMVDNAGMQKNRP
eukprot:9475777-Pyramimonas_sp.AAC.2